MSVQQILIEICEIILKDKVVENWAAVLDHIVRAADDRLKIKKLIRQAEYTKAVLGSLELWHEYGPDFTPDLTKVLCRQGFKETADLLEPLVDKLRAPDAASSFPKRRKVELLPTKWFPHKKELIVTFVDRTTPEGIPIVQQVRQQILSSASKVSAIVANKHTITGMGGIGKTSIAKWYGNVYEDDYDHIIWIDSEGPSLVSSINRLAKELEVESTESVESTLSWIYQKLAHTSCLFIFDNVQSYEGPNGIGRLLPTNELHHSIITSRSQQRGDIGGAEFGCIPTIELDVFTKDECNSLFSKVFPELDEQGKSDGLELSEELGYLPLALQTALATIKNSRWYTISSYLARLRRSLKIAIDRKVLNEYERRVSETLRLSIEQIEQDSELEVGVKELCKTILNVAAYCVPDAIYVDLFLGLPNATSEEINEAIDVLLMYSLVTDRVVRPNLIYEHESVFRIHCLLQEVLIRDEAELASARYAKMAFGCLEKTLNSERGLLPRKHDHDARRACEILLSRPPDFQASVLKSHYLLPHVMAKDWAQVGLHELVYSALKAIENVYAYEPTHHRAITAGIACAYLLLREGKRDEARLTSDYLIKSLQHSEAVLNPFKDKLELHVKLLSADVTLCSEELAEEDLRDSIDIYAKVLAQLASFEGSDYDGKIQDIAVYYRSIKESPDWIPELNWDRISTFRLKVALNYATLLRRNEENDLANELIWKQITGEGASRESVNMIDLHAVFEFLFQQEPVEDSDSSSKLVTIYQLASECLNRIDCNDWDDKLEYQLDLFWEIAPVYFRHAMYYTDTEPDTEPGATAAETHALALIEQFNWPTKLYEFQECMYEVVDALLVQCSYKAAERLCFSIVDSFQACLTNNRHGQAIRSRVEFLDRLIELNVSYTYELTSHEDESCIGMIQRADERLLRFLKTNITAEDLWAGNVWTDIRKTIRIPESIEDGEDIDEVEKSKIRTLFKSKLPIVLKIIFMSRAVEQDSIWANSYAAELLISMYDRATCALFYVGDFEQGKHLWIEVLTRVQNDDVDEATMMRLMLDIGDETLGLVLTQRCDEGPPGLMDEVIAVTAERLRPTVQKVHEFNFVEDVEYIWRAGRKIAAFLKWSNRRYSNQAIELISLLLKSRTYFRGRYTFEALSEIHAVVAAVQVAELDPISATRIQDLISQLENITAELKETFDDEEEDNDDTELTAEGAAAVHSTGRILAISAVDGGTSTLAIEGPMNFELGQKATVTSTRQPATRTKQIDGINSTRSTGRIN